MVFDLVVTEMPGGVTVLSATGELDMASAPRFRQELVRLASDAIDAPRLVVDLAGVDLLDTTGLAAILEGVKRCALRGGALELARAEPQVVRELELTRLSDALPVHATIDEAIVAVLARVAAG